MLSSLASLHENCHRKSIHDVTEQNGDLQRCYRVYALEKDTVQKKLATSCTIKHKIDMKDEMAVACSNVDHRETFNEFNYKESNEGCFVDKDTDDTKSYINNNYQNCYENRSDNFASKLEEYSESNKPKNYYDNKIKHYNQSEDLNVENIDNKPLGDDPIQGKDQMTKVTGNESMGTNGNTKKKENSRLFTIDVILKSENDYRTSSGPPNSPLQRSDQRVFAADNGSNLENHNENIDDYSAKEEEDEKDDEEDEIDIDGESMVKNRENFIENETENTPPERGIYKITDHKTPFHPQFLLPFNENNSAIFSAAMLYRYIASVKKTFTQPDPRLLFRWPFLFPTSTAFKTPTVLCLNA